MIPGTLFWTLLSTAEARPLTIWHAWRGQKRETLEGLVATWNAAHPDSPVEQLAVGPRERRSQWRVRPSGGLTRSSGADRSNGAPQNPPPKRMQNQVAPREPGG